MRALTQSIVSFIDGSSKYEYYANILWQMSFLDQIFMAEETSRERVLSLFAYLAGFRHGLLDLPRAAA